ncbi:MAG: exodeoxyribonuclease III [Patescibacteria group bacterium]
MRIVSWNINGLRSLHKQGYWKWFETEKPDILCLQEIKAESAQLAPEVAMPLGYFPFFNSSRGRKGYSGVAMYTKKKPLEVHYDILENGLDEEGRLIEAVFEDFVLINGYFPNGGQGPERLEYKLRFYDAFLKHVNSLVKQGKSVIFCGDINTAHEEIDLARPKENEKNTGFLPEERAWLDEVIAAGFVDTFRHFYPNKTGVYTYWDQKSRARDRNVGWRIDYFFVSPDLVPKLKKAEILPLVFGSDHCPLEIEVGI